MPVAAVSVLSLALALVFAWAASAKIVRFPDWKSALEAYPLSARIRAFAAVGVPVGEGVVVTLLVVGATRAGAALTVALIGSFSFALLRAQPAEDGRLPCGCFGKAKARDYRLMLVRNALIGVLAGLLLISGKDVGFLEGISSPRGDELLPAALGLAGVILGGWLIYESTVSFRGRRS
jgi:hypothetical protein